MIFRFMPGDATYLLGGAQLAFQIGLRGYISDGRVVQAIDERIRLLVQCLHRSAAHGATFDVPRYGLDGLRRQFAERKFGKRLAARAS